MTDPLLAPATAWLRKAWREFSLPIPSENPVSEGLNSLRMSKDHKHREDQETKLEITRLCTLCIYVRSLKS